jgi:hypothetical protein
VQNEVSSEVGRAPCPPTKALRESAQRINDSNGSILSILHGADDEGWPLCNVTGDKDVRNVRHVVGMALHETTRVQLDTKTVE